MDGTMIGRIGPQVCEWELLHTFQKNKLKAMRTDLVARLKQGVVRPYLAWLCSLAHSGDLDRVEMFVYTASDSKWAHFLIPCIEEAIGFKFNRPFFTRDHCVPAPHGEFRKSVSMVVPKVYQKLKSKYRLTDASPVAENIVLIDNNPEVLLHPGMEAVRLVTCPTYDFAYYYDVIGKIDLATLHARYQELIPVLKAFSLFPAGTVPGDVRSVQQFVFMYYQKLYDSSKAAWRDTIATDHISSGKKDRMWKHVGETLRDAQNGRIGTGTRSSHSSHSSHSKEGLSEEIIREMTKRMTSGGNDIGGSSTRQRIPNR